MHSDLDLALELADIADRTTMHWWSVAGVASDVKTDGTLVTAADIETEQVLLETVRRARPGDGFLGEEVGAHAGRNDRRWIVDGVDGTGFFAAGLDTWGTLIALEVDGEVTVGVTTSPAQGQRWWASRGQGSFMARTDRRDHPARLSVSNEDGRKSDRFIVFPRYDALSPDHQEIIADVAGGQPRDWPWSHANWVAAGVADTCVWFGGGPWDLAAPSILVEEAGGRFSDHRGGRRLDTRTAIFSNGARHNDVLVALAPTLDTV